MFLLSVQSSKPQKGIDLRLNQIYQETPEFSESEVCPSYFNNIKAVTGGHCEAY